MFISKKNYLRNIKRIRIPENLDSKNALRLHRNERVENWGSEIVKEIFSNKPDWFLNTYPDSSNLYKKTSVKFLKKFVFIVQIINNTRIASICDFFLYTIIN